MSAENANSPGDRSKIIAMIAWILLLTSYWWYASANGLTPSQTMQVLIGFISESPYGLPIYILVYMIRPIFLFPATLVTMAATYLYGPVQGIAYALIASNLSTLVAFLIGRFFGNTFLHSIERNTLVIKYADRLRRESFQTTLVLRFLFLPYDLVSYFSGFLKIDLGWFMLATVLGSIPGTISFGMLGASIQGDFASQNVSLDPLSLVLSAVTFALSLGLYRFVRQREGNIV
jgi:uncharacterized membrane protein YdjX (TVP38/TMEM64 family)